MKLLVAVTFMFLVISGAIAKSEYKIIVADCYAASDLEKYYEKYKVIESTDTLKPTNPSDAFKPPNNSDTYTAADSSEQNKKRWMDKGKLIQLKQGTKVEVIGIITEETNPVRIVQIKILNKKCPVPHIVSIG